MSRIFKVAHSADWHLLLRFLPQLKHPLVALVEKTEELKPDLFLHAGDVFDERGIFDSDAVWWARWAFARIRKICPVGVVPGNHDVPHDWDRVDDVTAALGGRRSPDEEAWIPDLLSKIPVPGSSRAEFRLYPASAKAPKTHVIIPSGQMK